MYNLVIDSFFKPKENEIISRLIEIQKNPVQYFSLSYKTFKALYFEIEPLDVFHLKYVVFPRLEPNEDRYYDQLFLEFDSNLDFDDLNEILLNNTNKCKECWAYEECQHAFKEHKLAEISCDCVDDWIKENTECEFEFLSNCWIKAKDITKSTLKGFIAVHESTVDYDLDERKFIEEAGL